MGESDLFDAPPFAFRYDHIIDADRDTLRHSLQRTAILSNEKYRGIRLNIKPGVLTLQAHNPEQEEAQEEIEA
ncbi:MAG: hypothetical protein LH471_09125, partial [Salinibacterium sp.]|nr:hypothetical protein [Salinibacterium sp.]